MALETLPLELRKLGLTEKEARVYLATLKLGYTSIQKIAQQTKISRPTTYSIIKSLKEKGLISQSKDKSKKYFTAESPDKLLNILKREKKEIDEKEREFLRIIALLKDKDQLGDKRDVKVYKTKNSIEILFNDFLTTQSKKIYVLANNEKIWSFKTREAIYQKIRKRLGKIEIKELSTDTTIKKDYLEKKLLKSKSSFNGIIVIYDKVIILPDQSSGILIENKTIVDLIKSFFLCLWEK